LIFDVEGFVVLLKGFDYFEKFATFKIISRTICGVNLLGVSTA
jgi:hypothetical protein